MTSSPTDFQRHIVGLMMCETREAAHQCFTDWVDAQNPGNRLKTNDHIYVVLGTAAPDVLLVRNSRLKTYSIQLSPYYYPGDHVANADPIRLERETDDNRPGTVVTTGNIRTVVSI